MACGFSREGCDSRDCGLGWLFVRAADWLIREREDELVCGRCLRERELEPCEVERPRNDLDDDLEDDLEDEDLDDDFPLDLAIAEEAPPKATIMERARQ